MGNIYSRDLTFFKIPHTVTISYNISGWSLNYNRKTVKQWALLHFTCSSFYLPFFYINPTPCNPLTHQLNQLLPNPEKQNPISSIRDSLSCFHGQHEVCVRRCPAVLGGCHGTHGTCHHVRPGHQFPGFMHQFPEERWADSAVMLRRSEVPQLRRKDHPRPPGRLQLPQKRRRRHLWIQC